MRLSLVLVILDESGRMFLSSRTVVLMKAGSIKCGGEQQGTVDRNSCSVPPPGQEDFYCKYTMSFPNISHSHRGSENRQIVPVATEQQSPFTTFSR